MTTNTSHTCESCTLAACRFKNEAKYPKYCLTANADQDLVDETITIYKENKELGDIARISASIEGEFYGRYTRVEETIEFIKRMAITAASDFFIAFRVVVSVMSLTD